MFFRLLILLPVLVVAMAPARARERVEERTFAGPGAAVLKINVRSGNIIIESSDEPGMRARVTATSPLEDDAAAGRALQNLRLNWRQEGGAVVLETENPAESALRFAWQEAIGLDVEIKVTVPRECQLELETSRGDIRVGEIRGQIRLTTGRGYLGCRYVDGSVVARSAAGDILVSHCTGDVDLRTGKGGIVTGRIGGRATLAAVSGDIDVMAVRQGLNACVDGGDMVAGIPRQFSGESSLRTSGGSITLKIDPAANLDLDTASVWGRVRAVTARTLKPLLQVVSGGLGQKSLVGRFNAGGARIQARASGGHVNLADVVTPFSDG